MSSEFTNMKLIDISSKIGSGSTPRGGKEAYLQEGISLIRSQNIHDFQFSYDGLAFIDDKQAYDLRNVEVQETDVLLNITGDSVARCCMPDKYALPARVNQHVAIIRAKEEIVSPHFIKYSLLNPVMKMKLLSLASHGATRNALTKSMIENIELSLPEIVHQKKITSILSTLDNKIELNNRMNKILEQMAQAIFKQWFVDFDFPNENGEPYKSSGGEMIESDLGMIPEGWEVVELSDLVKVIDNRGKTPPLSIEKTTYPILDVKALSGDSRIIDYDDCMKFVSHESYENWFRNGHPKSGDILLSTVGSLAEMKIFYGNSGCIAQNVVALRCIEISTLYMYQYMKNIKSDLILYNIGTVQPSIKVTHIIKHKILKPKSDLEKKYHNLMNQQSNLIYNNFLQTKNLKNIRDTLLPKLMSGEIDVSNIEL
jgi:type I restriction enzyme S subunit